MIYRLLVLLWFLAYMASIYLALHMLVARFSTSQSKVLWFFSIITSPLVRPVRALLPPGTSEARLRLVTLAICVSVWLGLRLLLARLGGVDLG